MTDVTANLKDEAVEVDHLFTTAEAIKFVKRVSRIGGTRFCLHVRADAFIEDKPDHVYASGLTHYVNLTKPQTLDLVSHMLRENLEAKGGRIRIKEYTRFKSTTYWIG